MVSNTFILRHAGRGLSLIAGFLFSFTVLNAQAAFIDFDDLTYVPPADGGTHFSDMPITNQYESLGLIIVDGYLRPYGSRPDLDPNFVSGPNYLLGGTTMTFSFVGQLPTFVGMHVFSYRNEAISMVAYNESGDRVASATSSGFGGPDHDIPYVPKEYFTLTSTSGISRIDFWGFFHRSTAANIDDLTFTYAEVPEPPMTTLIGVGLLLVIYRRWKSAITAPALVFGA